MSPNRTTPATSVKSRDDRIVELREMADRDPQALIQLWLDLAGTPEATDRDSEIDLHAVVIPAILKFEFPDAEQDA